MEKTTTNKSACLITTTLTYDVFAICYLGSMVTDSVSNYLKWAPIESLR